MTQASSQAESPQALVLPAWAGTATAVLNFAVRVAGMICALVGSMALVHGYWGTHEALGWLLVPLIWITAVAVHEYGHVLGARAMGMTPYLMAIGPLQMWAQKRGWRIRWRRQSRGYAGLVAAYVNPHTALRNQNLVMVAGGPAANLVAAAVVALLALYVRQPDINAFLYGIAGFNLAMALANLLPRRTTFASDGMLILEWLKGIHGQSMGLLISRLDGLSVQGVTADKLPQDLLDKLQNHPSPGPLFHSWFAIKGLQNRQQWTQVLELETQFEERIAALPAEHKTSFNELIGLIRSEIAFSKVMAGQPCTQNIDEGVGAEVDWASPGLRPRFKALMAVRQGDNALARSLLATSERHVARSIDRALILSEAIIRDAIVREMGRQG